MQYARVESYVSTPVHLNVLDVDPSLNVQPVSHSMVTELVEEPVSMVPLTGFIVAMWPVDWSDSEGSVQTAENTRQYLITCTTL